MPHTRIKLCGMTRAEDVRLAVELGVDYIGLILAARGPRQLRLDQARRLRALVPPEVGVVALLMDNAPDDVQAIVEDMQPDLLQFHGAEDDAFCGSWGRPFVKALPMGDPGDAEVLRRVERFPSAWGFVLDGHRSGQPGGSGQAFDWQRWPALPRPALLAGGLHPENVETAVKTARPWGVDVASGIESAPGIKDPEKMRAFVARVRAADVER